MPQEAISALWAKFGLAPGCCSPIEHLLAPAAMANLALNVYHPTRMSYRAQELVVLCQGGHLPQLCVQEILRDYLAHLIFGLNESRKMDFELLIWENPYQL